MKASGNAASVSPLRPANEPTKTPDHSPEHRTPGVYFTLICSMENDSTDISGNVHNLQGCPWDLYLLQLSPCCASSSLNQDGLPRVIMNAAFQWIKQCSEGVLLLCRLQSRVSWTGDSTRHPNSLTPKRLTSGFLIIAQPLAAQLLPEQVTLQQKDSSPELSYWACD